MLNWIESNGGLKELELRNISKAKKIYSFLDDNKANQFTDKGRKNPKASKAYWRFAPRLGRRVAQGMLSLGHAARRGRTPGGAST